VTDSNPSAVNSLHLSATNSFTVVVNEVNSAPILSAQTNRSLNELTTLTVTNSASDSDLPANPLSYTLLNPPAGATIDANGVITWTPTEAQGPSTNVITTVVTDTNTNAVNAQHLSATNSFTVVVNEVNVAPVLSTLPNATINELTLLTVTNTATDSDLPVNALSYTLVNPPADAAIDVNGIITWTPSEAQGPGLYTLTTVVTDSSPNAVNAQHLSATNSFTVNVNEVNSAPLLPVQPNQAINELTTLTVTNSATDSDLPANGLSYSLLNPPAGATIDAN
jgi:Bacterial Ig domain